MKKQPYTLTAYIPRKTGNPINFNTETRLQTAAHAAGIADPFCPDVPEQKAQDAAVRLLTAEIKTRYPAHGQIKYKLYQATL